MRERGSEVRGVERVGTAGAGLVLLAVVAFTAVYGSLVPRAELHVRDLAGLPIGIVLGIVGPMILPVLHGLGTALLGGPGQAFVRPPVASFAAPVRESIASRAQRVERRARELGFRLRSRHDGGELLFAFERDSAPFASTYRGLAMTGGLRLASEGEEGHVEGRLHLRSRVIVDTGEAAAAHAVLAYLAGEGDALELAPRDEGWIAALQLGVLLAAALGAYAAGAPALVLLVAGPLALQALVLSVGFLLGGLSRPPRPAGVPVLTLTFLASALALLCLVHAVLVAAGDAS